ncbi:hypothetical protein KAX02_07420 [candidate division WOR-3 bacterium]|nr:hypothetical protein [candidate division WOR-3 bacterium]
MKEVMMCGRRNRCCPVWTQQDDGNITITDDYDGIVVFTKEQWEIMKEKIVLGEI